MSKQRADSSNSSPDARRQFVKSLSLATMTGGVVAGYGGLAYVAGRFLFPAGHSGGQWQYAASMDQLRPGESMEYVAPDGAKVVIARQSAGDTADSFIALSSVCPHLGCQVHWEAQNDRFFCPCHNGAFDRSGEPTQGPPKTANQSLTRFPLQVQDGLLYIEVSGTSMRREPEEES